MSARHGRSLSSSDDPACPPSPAVAAAASGTQHGAVPGDPRLGRGIGQHGVDLPRRPVGSLDPHLVLDGEATGGLLLDLGLEPLAAQAASGGRDLLGGPHLDAEVVEGPGDAVAAGVRVSISTSLSGGSAMAKLAYPGPALGRLGAEQLGVEVDRLVEVGDVEGELDSDIGYLRYIDEVRCIEYG